MKRPRGERPPWVPGRRARRGAAAGASVVFGPTSRLPIGSMSASGRHGPITKTPLPIEASMSFTVKSASLIGSKVASRFVAAELAQVVEGRHLEEIDELVALLDVAFGEVVAVDVAECIGQRIGHPQRAAVRVGAAVGEIARHAVRAVAVVAPGRHHAAAVVDAVVADQHAAEAADQVEGTEAFGRDVGLDLEIQHVHPLRGDRVLGVEVVGHAAQRRLAVAVDLDAPVEEVEGASRAPREQEREEGDAGDRSVRRGAHGGRRRGRARIGARPRAVPSRRCTGCACRPRRARARRRGRSPHRPGRPWSRTRCRPCRAARWQSPRTPSVPRRSSCRRWPRSSR